MKEDCQLHTGLIYPNGYGYVQFCTNKKRTSALAHRISWALHNGADPRGGVVMHTCDTRACVNPEHLVLGTPSENMRDMVAKGRCKHGHANGVLKLTPSDIVKIKQLLVVKTPQRAVAKLFGVTQSVISDINIGKRYGSPRWK